MIIITTYVHGTDCPRSIAQKARPDAPTRAQDIKTREAAWALLMPTLVDAYLVWKHGPTLPSREDSHEPPADPASQGAGQDWFTVAAIRDTGEFLIILLRCADGKGTDFERYMRIEQPSGTHPVIALMRAGMVACTPGVPVVAISIGILDLYYRLCRHAPRLGIQPFVRALCDRYMVRTLLTFHFRKLMHPQCQYRPYLREQFSLAFDAYLALQREVQRRLDTALGHDAPNWRAHNSCACCNYKVRTSPAPLFSLLTRSSLRMNRRLR